MRPRTFIVVDSAVSGSDGACPFHVLEQFLWGMNADLSQTLELDLTLLIFHHLYLCFVSQEILNLLPKDLKVADVDVVLAFAR